MGELNSETVKEYGRSAGATVVGIAVSEDFGLAPEGFKPSDKLEGCRSVIVLGVPFPRESLFGTYSEYTDVRNATYKRMDAIAKDVAKRIKNDGYKTKAIGGIGGKWIDGFTHGTISLKHAAELAGLGIIGKNYLLISPEYGTLLWFSAVLTDAPLTPDGRSEYDVCRDCNICVETCPSGALDNYPEFGKKVCARTCFKMVNKKWEIHCYLCRKMCPHRFGGKVDVADSVKTE